jgi:hypothetical protein
LNVISADSPPGEAIKSDSYAEQLDNETGRHPLQAVNNQLEI